MVDVMRDLFGVLVRGPRGGTPQARQFDFLGVLAEGRTESRVQVPAWMERIGKAMELNDKGLPTAESVGRRWAEMLARRYPGAHAAKRIAEDLDRDVRTVQAWMAGQAPYLHVAVEAALVWRDPAVLFELAGLAPPSEAELGRELTEVRRQLAELSTRLARLTERAP